MASYQQLRMSELRELCDECGIDRRGLKKAQLVQALRAWDDGNELEGGDNEVIINGGDDGRHARGNSGVAMASTVPSQTSENESVEILRLKLALTEQQAKYDKERDERASLAREREIEAREREWEIERERIASQAQNNPLAPHSNRAVST